MNEIASWFTWQTLVVGTAGWMGASYLTNPDWVFRGRPWWVITKAVFMLGINITTIVILIRAILGL